MTSLLDVRPPSSRAGDEASALLRLATLAAPSSHAIAGGNRRDIVRDFELEARVEFARLQLRRIIEIRLRCITRRLRMEAKR